MEAQIRTARRADARASAEPACSKPSSPGCSTASSTRRSGRTRSSTWRRCASRRTDHLVCIASGGCNVMSYLTAAPASITAVDLNRRPRRAQPAEARRRPPPSRPRGVPRMFAAGRPASNVALYDDIIAPHLDAATRAYWEERDARAAAHHHVRPRLPPLRRARPLHRRRRISRPGSAGSTPTPLLAAPRSPSSSTSSTPSSRRSSTSAVVRFLARRRARALRPRHPAGAIREALPPTAAATSCRSARACPQARLRLPRRRQLLRLAGLRPRLRPRRGARAAALSRARATSRPFAPMRRRARVLNRSR